MPSINLRLSDTELVLLRDWAHDSRRSLQKEVVYRLFSGLTEREPASKASANLARADERMSEAPAAQARSVSPEPTGPIIQDRKSVDADWLRRRAGGKK